MAAAEKIETGEPITGVTSNALGIVETFDEKVITPENKDDALDLFAGHPEGIEYTAKEANWVRWKIDLILMPTMMFAYVLNYMDKAALAEGSIFGLQKDLHLVGQQYSWSSSVFFLGYLVWQYPSSILMQKLPIGRYFGTMIILWGITATCTVATKNFATLAIDRVFLGVFETCMSPILTILVGQYWTRQEQPLRACIWWAGSATGGFLVDSITYGVSGSTFGGSKYATWQILYLILGPLTIVFGIFVMLALPTNPMTAWFLTERERKIAVLRVIKNHTGIENRHYKFYQVKECFMDPQVWLLFALGFCQCISGGGLLSFDKLILTGLGYSGRSATLMALPSDTIHLLSIIAAGFICSYLKNVRCIVIICTNIATLIALLIIQNLPNSKDNLRLGAFYVLYIDSLSFVLPMSLISSNIAGFTKKSTASTIFFIGYCLGQFAGPQFFKTSEAPRYPTGFKALYTAVSLSIGFGSILMVYLWWMNKKRDMKDRENGLGVDGRNEEEVTAADFLDMTDWERRDFRYVW